MEGKGKMEIFLTFGFSSLSEEEISKAQMSLCIPGFIPGRGAHAQRG